MAAPPPLVALREAAVAFGGVPVFTGLSFGLLRGERMCLVGRNGSGKSTLLKLLAGTMQPDAGERFVQPGVTAAYLPQDPTPPKDMTVAGYVADGLDSATAGGAPMRHRVDEVLARVGLTGQRRLGELSGGAFRRAALARTLVTDPDVLLLDEPTNHLDLPAIEWLEEELRRFRGALLVISHDRAFLTRVATATLWLDRGRLHRLDKNFSHFEAWAEDQREREEQDRHKLTRRIVREERWLNRGVTARRRRNQGRLARLEALRRQRRDWLREREPGKLAVAAGDRRGNLVIEAEHLSKSYPGADGVPHRVIDGFSIRIQRGDRIGLIGPNGAGKTTLVRLLIGTLEPDGGRLRLGAKITPLYFDQQRESLDPEATLWKALVPDGGDSLRVGNRQRHVVSYLRDFLFDESQARQPVKSLSGGERNRLLLARLFAQPSDLLVLDEPTNDLDMETLDLLVEVLDEYPGTLILVSHDRDFLDRLATGLIALEGDGRAVEYAGGYSDYLAQRRGADERPEPRKVRKTEREPPGARPKRRPGKLGYKEQRELDGLPERIETLTAEIATLESRLADSALYSRDPGAFETATRDLATARHSLGEAEARWLELEARREQLEAMGGEG